MLLPTGETAYTRAGNFSVNDQGQTGHRRRLSGAADHHRAAERHQRHHLPDRPGAGDIAGGRPRRSLVGQLQLATFLNEAGLEAIGNNLFMETAASGAPTAGQPGQPGFGTVMQGYTEASNVDPVSEITNLIVAQRAYEMNSKVVTTADQMLSTAVQSKQ